jgi:glycosyltransferase involved in cell wall biosynthesis
MRHTTSPFFSVITPTWNRAEYLRRVHDGLIKQHFRNFEWIVADDGSSDETPSVILELAADSSFTVTYIRADRHVGKIRMDNALVKQARGQLILWCDSDDWLLPQALERLWEIWDSIPKDQRDGFVGLTALAATADEGPIANPFPGNSSKDVRWNDLAGIHRDTGDMLICIKADVLKAHPFPEVDLVIPESVVWTAIGDRPARLTPEVLLMKEYRAAHGLSFARTMGYNRGRAYSMATTVRNLRGYSTSRTRKILNLLNFIRYSLHGEILVFDARELWGGNSGNVAYWLTFPLAFALAIKDRFQNKVRKTHREFLAVRDSARLVTQVLNSGDPG